jgi:hypothetical protein
MAIIINPTLTDLTELDMYTSNHFQKHQHEIVSIQIRNHNKDHKTKDSTNEYVLPKGIVKTNKVKKYRKRININTEIKLQIDDIDPIGGIEKLKKHLIKEHPNADFYVLRLVTRTLGSTRHTCIWKREAASASNSNIVSLHLTHIDDKKVLEHFAETEMWQIVGTFPDDKCRLRTEVTNKTVIVCDPIVR